MKKFIKVITFLLAVVCLSTAFVGCGKSDWGGTTLNKWGAVKSNNGFVAETENYVYFINGQGSNTEDNTFGAPVKGSLMAITKTDFVQGKTEKAEIVVPKLFVASDYNAGLYLSGDYVYYGTPSLDKDSSGKVANSEMAFAKSKLDGTETKILFTVGSLSTEYRILEKDGNVYIVYYDQTAKAVKVYDVSGAKTTVLSKTDDTADTSLAEYKFVEDTSDGVAVVFTETVYAEKYYSEKAEKDGYSRTTAQYNVVYKYSVGDEKPVEVLNGKEYAYTYTLTYTDGRCVFYTQTDVNGNAKVYGTLSSEIADTTKRQLINDSTSLATSTYIVSLTEIYKYDSDALTIYKTTLVGSEIKVRETVAKVDSISSIATIDGDYIYYYNSDNNLYRIKMCDGSANAERVSEDSATATWYAPEILTIGNDKFMLYCDSSSLGNYYIKYVNISNTAVEDDDAVDGYSLSGNTLLGKITAEDSAKYVVALLDSATTSTELDYEITDEGISFGDADVAISAYKKLSEEALEFVSEDNKTKFANVESAIKLSNLYNGLSKVKDYDGSDAQKTALETAYQTATAFRQELIDNGTYTAVRQMTPTTFKWYYQETAKLFK